MIFIDIRNTHSDIESTLTNKEKKHREKALQKVKEAYNLASQIKIDKKNYQYKQIRDSFLICQKNKCAYCECSIYMGTNNSIEHYRPKNSYIQKHGRKEHRPGYYWLAYDLSNLFVACTTCNSTKANFFPLLLHTTRCSNHHESIAKEDPLIINPLEIDPTDHIFFDKNIIKSKTQKGKITIKYLDLNRINLLDERNNVYDSLFLLKLFSNRSKKGLINYRRRLQEAEEGKTQYSKMIIDNFSLV